MRGERSCGECVSAATPPTAQDKVRIGVRASAQAMFVPNDVLRAEAEATPRTG
jgi:hypothetical protein